jgi:nucleotide-binding universal stress UspA family protein
MKDRFRHAMVTLDQSESSDIIVECLPHFKKFGTEKITLFTSVSVPYPGGLSKKNEKRMKDSMERYKSLVGEEGYTVFAELRFDINSYAPREIIEAAKNHKVDYLIIGNRGHSKVHDLVLGSTASETMQRSHLPVYLIKIHATHEKEFQDRKLYCARACRDSFDHILYATDFSETAEQAFEALRDVAGQFAKKITLFHVQSIGRIGTDDPLKLEEFNRIDRERLEKRKELLQKNTDAVIDINISYGSTAHEILREADESGATLIVMGSQGRGYVRELFIGGVAYKVMRGSNIPVFILSARRDA